MTVLYIRPSRACTVRCRHPGRCGRLRCQHRDHLDTGGASPAAPVEPAALAVPRAAALVTAEGPPRLGLVRAMRLKPATSPSSEAAWNWECERLPSHTRRLSGPQPRVSSLRRLQVGVTRGLIEELVVCENRQDSRGCRAHKFVKATLHQADREAAEARSKRQHGASAVEILRGQATLLRVACPPMNM
jgi:hypothetical protein